MRSIWRPGPEPQKRNMATYLGKDEAGHPCWEIDGQTYTGSVSTVGGGTPVIGRLYPAWCNQPDSRSQWVALVRPGVSKILPKDFIVRLLGQWPYYCQSSRRQSTGMEIAAETSTLTNNTVLLNPLGNVRAIRVSGGYIFAADFNTLGGGSIVRGVLGASFPEDTNLYFGSAFLDVIAPNFGSESDPEDPTTVELYIVEASTIRRISGLDEGFMAVTWSAAMSPLTATRQPCLYADTTNVYCLGTGIFSGNLKLARGAWGKGDGTLVDVVGLQQDLIPNPPFLGRWLVSEGEPDDFEGSGTIRRPFRNLEPNQVAGMWLVYPWSTTGSAGTAGLQAQAPAGFKNFPTSLSGILANPTLNRFVPGLKNAIQLGAYVGTTGERTAVIKGDNGDTWDFYTPILELSDGRILVRIRRVEFATYEWNDAKLTFTEPTLEPVGFYIAAHGSQKMTDVPFTQENIPARGRLVKKSEVLMATWDGSTSSLSTPWPITTEKILSTVYVPTGSASAPYPWAHYWGYSQWDPEIENYTTDWWIEDGHIVTRGTVDTRRSQHLSVHNNLYTSWNGGALSTDSDDSLVAIISAQCTDEALLPWGGEADGSTQAVSQTSIIGDGGTISVSSNISIAASWMPPEQTYVNRLVWPAVGVETQIDYPLKHSDLIAYLSPNEDLVIFPPNTALYPGDSNVLPDMQFEWDGAYAGGGGVSDNFVHFHDITLSEDYDRNVKQWIVAKTLAGVTAWEHEMPPATFVSNIVSTKDGRTFIRYRIHESLDEGGTSDTWIRVIETATGNLIQEFAQGAYPYLITESPTRGQHRGVCADVLVAAGGRLLQTSGSTVSDLFPLP